MYRLRRNFGRQDKEERNVYIFCSCFSELYTSMIASLALILATKKQNLSFWVISSVCQQLLIKFECKVGKYTRFIATSSYIE